MEQPKIVFHTDLDNTLIYSYKHELGADKHCVEVYHGREISFITAETERLLQQIKARENQIVMIPTTTRTTEQYHRIQLGIGELPYALVCGTDSGQQGDAASGAGAFGEGSEEKL